MHDLYEADPATAGRVWKGPSDCSAQVWLMCAGPGRMRIRVAVVDDVRVEDDDGRGVDAWLSLSEGREAPTVRLGGPDSD